MATIPALPKTEDAIGEALSPYAVSKRANELYAAVFARCYGMHTVGMRYFNVFGPRQDPEGAYAAVIPRWISAMLCGEPTEVNGDGETTRDFCYVANAVQANLLAALTDDPQALNRVYNVAVGERMSLNRLLDVLRELLSEMQGDLARYARCTDLSATGTCSIRSPISTWHASSLGMRRATT